MMSFPCTSCGACCMSVRGVLPLEALQWVDDTGVCVKYDAKRKQCTVYQSRPMVCRIDEGRPVMFEESVWQSLNLAACDTLHLTVYGELREQTGACSHAPKE